ncbi:MAG: hypothetical protein IJ552_07505 [Prevotella sp.]|nr:hypothetical protein [Prevotella sp.]
MKSDKIRSGSATISKQKRIFKQKQFWKSDGRRIKQNSEVSRQSLAQRCSSTSSRLIQKTDTCTTSRTTSRTQDHADRSTTCTTDQTLAQQQTQNHSAIESPDAAQRQSADQFWIFICQCRRRIKAGSAETERKTDLPEVSDAASSRSCSQKSKILSAEIQTEAHEDSDFQIWT